MKTVLAFLTELKSNNTREWFQANKEWYGEARREMESMVNTLIPAIGEFDPPVRFVPAKDCMFRIFRDVRFSKDKSPYKINMGAWITPAGRKSCGPGYYVHIQPGESFLSAGIYMPDPDTLKRVRREIFYNGGKLKEILGQKELTKYAAGLDEMDMLKNPPKDFPGDFPDIGLLKRRHYTISHPLAQKQVESEAFTGYVLKAFRAMYPFNEFLRMAVV
jgi:uncharacterized protein (TIGR02453 family)